jgi:RNA polymerase sigma factor for flagellar operon FliA
LLKLALHELNEKEALVIQLYYVEELNVFEIAEVLEVSTGRVSQIKKAAIANLRAYIAKSQHID